MVLEGVSDAVTHSAARQMEHSVYAFKRLGDAVRVADIALDQSDVRSPAGVGQIGLTSRGKVIENSDTAVRKRVDQMRADETGTSGHQDGFSLELHGRSVASRKGLRRIRPICRRCSSGVLNRRGDVVDLLVAEGGKHRQRKAACHHVFRNWEIARLAARSRA